MSRPDLLALDDDALAALANRGLVKRARKEIERGEVPALTLLDDGTVEATFPDGVLTRLPVGVPLRDAPCSCSAQGMCRHKLATVMALQVAAPPAAPTGPAPLPPFGLDDAHLEKRLGRRALMAAQRAVKGGIAVRVQLGPQPAILLPTCTLSFLVPWDLAHVRCDCVDAVDCSHVALAVWALRELGPEDWSRTDPVHVQLGGASADTPLVGVDALIDDLLRGGWSQAAGPLAERVERLRPALTRDGAQWILDLLDQLLHDLSAYADAAQGSDVDVVADAIGELHVRIRARPVAPLLRAHLHGERVEGSTALDHTVLHGLGARVMRRGNELRLAVYLADGDRPDALVHERVMPWTGSETGPALAQRRLWKATTRTVASGRVVTRGATRRPNRLVDVGGTQTSVMPATAASLGRRVEGLATIVDRLTARGPGAFQPRVKAWNVVTVSPEALEGPFWDPATRTVWALLEQGGVQACLLAEWRPEAPGRAAATARGLVPGAVLTAEARLAGGVLALDPLWVDGVAVDLADEAELPELPVRPRPLGPDPLTALLARVRRLLSELALHGTQTMRRSARAANDELTADARAVGLHQLADRLAALDAADPADRPRRWRAAWARCVWLEHAAAVRGIQPG